MTPPFGRGVIAPPGRGVDALGARPGAAVGPVWAAWCALVDLVLPVRCAGCGAGGGVLCDRCAGALLGAVPRPAAPRPAPPGLPPVITVGDYAGPLARLVVAYKDRGRHRLAVTLGAALAAAVAVAAGTSRSPVVLLVPVPATAAAARRRHGDHMTRLARRAAVALRAWGVSVAVAHPLRTRHRPDSAGLSAVQRRRAAAAFAVRPRRIPAVREAARAGARIVVVDDVMTTGATIAAVTVRLTEVGVPVDGAAVLATTRRRCR